MSCTGVVHHPAPSAKIYVGLEHRQLPIEKPERPSQQKAEKRV